MNCRGCGVHIDPTDEQVNAAVDEVLESSLQDAVKTGGVCPLCGHSKQVPYSHRKAVQFWLLFASLLLLAGVAATVYYLRQTARATAVREAVQRLNANPEAVRILGSPITASSKVSGQVKEDETGWREARLVIALHGPLAEATARVVAGSPTNGKWLFPAKAQWTFSTFEVLIEKQHKKLDLVTGKVVDYDPATYVDVHAQAAVDADVTYLTAAPTLSGTFPCVYAVVTGSNVTPQVGECDMATTHSAPVDRFEADLRYGRFILRQTDLHLKDVFDVPLTRTYASDEWANRNPVHAFGRNANHPFDISPSGSRNPYTFILLPTADGERLYFKRISKGTGYADAVFQHVETATRFYKATMRWNGNGWTVNLADGSSIMFPESYNAKNMAQGAATEIIDAKGNKLELHRDRRRNLREIRTPHGQTITFMYDDHDRIVRAEDDQHNWAQYQYNAADLLTDAVLSSGKERHYQYDGILMTWIRDENGRVLLHNWYNERGILKRQDFGDGSTFTYAYHNYGAPFADDSVTVTLPDGTTKEIRTSQAVPDFEKHPPQNQEEHPRRIPVGILQVICGFLCLYIAFVRCTAKFATASSDERKRAIQRIRLVYAALAVVFFCVAVQMLRP